MNYKGLMRIPDSGGEPVLLAGLDAGIGENSLRFPQFFADGDHFVYFSRTLDPGKNAIYLDALKTVGKVPRKRLLSSEGPCALGRDPQTGRDFLLVPKERRLWAQQVDESSGGVRGELLAVSDDVGQFSLSATGTLVFRRASSERNSLSWIDRGGRQQGSVGQPGDYWDVALSPDERHAAALNHHSADGRFWVEMIDLVRNSQTPFSDPTARTAGLAWSRDGAKLYFTSWNEKQGQVLVRGLDSAAAAQPVLAAADRYDIRSVAPDGKTLAADGRKPGNYEGMAFAFNGQPLWKQPFLFPAGVLASMGQFSPDGKWVAYESTESGAADIYVSDFPGLASRRRISTDGGAEPRWAADGKSLFYVMPDNMLLVVPVLDASHMTFGSPERLFHLPGRVTASGGRSYDVARDGRRFLTVNTIPPAAARNLGVIFNWPQLMDGDARH